MDRGACGRAVYLIFVQCELGNGQGSRLWGRSFKISTRCMLGVDRGAGGMDDYIKLL